MPKCGLVGGKIEMFFNNQTIHPTAVEVYDSINYLNQKNMLRSINMVLQQIFTFKVFL